MTQLQKWLGEKCKWNLCYRASRDGWSAQDFHKHCDNKGPTVVLVKANDCIFGGYTDQHWESSGTVRYVRKDLYTNICIIYESYIFVLQTGLIKLFPLLHGNFVRSM